MKRYFVKETSISTENNPRGANHISVTLFGKGDEMLKHESTFPGSDNFDLMWFKAEEYGYKRLSDAKRNWSYKNPQNDKMWRSKVEIIEVNMYGTGYCTEQRVG